MSRYLLSAAAVTALVAQIVSAEDPANAALPKLIAEPWERPATAAEQYQDLVAEHRSAQARYDIHVRRARTEAENERLTMAYGKKLESLAMRFLELAREAAGESAGIDALLWVATHRPSAMRSESLVEMLHGHRHSDRVLLINRHLAQADSPAAEAISRALISGK